MKQGRLTMKITTRHNTLLYIDALKQKGKSSSYNNYDFKLHYQQTVRVRK